MNHSSSAPALWNILLTFFFLPVQFLCAERYIWQYPFNMLSTSFAYDLNWPKALLAYCVVWYGEYYGFDAFWYYNDIATDATMAWTGRTIAELYLFIRLKVATLNSAHFKIVCCQKDQSYHLTLIAQDKQKQCSCDRKFRKSENLSTAQNRKIESEW